MASFTTLQKTEWSTLVRLAGLSRRLARALLDNLKLFNDSPEA